MLGQWIRLRDRNDTGHLLNISQVVRVSSEPNGKATIVMSDGIIIYLPDDYESVVRDIEAGRSK